MDYTLLDWLLALAPMVLVLVLMVGRRWTAIRAGFTGMTLAILLAVVQFKAGAEAIAYAQVSALILAIDVSLIIWAALVLYYVVDLAGALRVIADALAGLTQDTLIQVLLLAWVFASFMQGVGGFGVPVAITAPLLIGLGISQSRAVVAPALGHGWAVTFGSLAASFLMLQRVSELPGSKLAFPAALMLGVLGYLSGFMVAHVIEGWRGVRRAAPYVLVVGTAMSGAQMLLAVTGLWTLGAIGGGLAGLIVSVIWIRAQRPQHTSSPAEVAAAPAATEPARSTPRAQPSVPLALAGYILLIVLAFGLRGIAPVKTFLTDLIALSVDIPASTTDRGWAVATQENAGFGILAHPGFIIFVTCAVTYAVYRRAGLYFPGAEAKIVKESGRRAYNSAVGHYTMVAIAATMSRAGMMEVIADGLSSAVPGDLYAFVAPVIGALGAFVTGSNVNSNAVFAILQRDTAELLGLSVLAILAAQTAAAAVISVMSPAKVTVGCSTVGADEGDVLRRLLGYGAVVILVVGIMAWIGVQIG